MQSADATSIPAVQPVSESSVTKPAHPPSSRKRPPFGRKNRINENVPSKKQKASFEKQPDSAILYTTTLLLYFEVHASFRGLTDLSTCLYSVLITRDPKLHFMLGELELRYSILMSCIYRCCLIANHAKCTVISGLSRLKDVLLDLHFPEIVCHYIESFGVTELNGLKLVPFFRDYREMTQRADFENPAFILRILGIPIPDTTFSIHNEPILRYARACSRLKRTLLSVRAVDYKNLEGRPEFLATYADDEDHRTSVFAFEKTPMNVCQLGAALRYRNKDFQNVWDGIKFPITHGCTGIDREAFITSYVNASLR